LNREKRSRVADSRFDFHPVSNDRRIRSECLDSILRVSRHLPRIELAEGAAIAFPFLEHDRPTEPRLRRFEHEEFEVLAIVMNRHTPFAIVILQHRRIVAADPGTPDDAPLRHDSSILTSNGDRISWLPSRQALRRRRVAVWVFAQVRFDDRTDRQNSQVLPFGRSSKTPAMRPANGSGSTGLVGHQREADQEKSQRLDW
jgi:hypothetical protein